MVMKGVMPQVKTTMQLVNKCGGYCSLFSTISVITVKSI